MSRYPCRAVLEELRERDGAQKYRREDGDVDWITGWPRTANAEIGMTGTLVYRTSHRYGLVFFERDSALEERKKP